MARFPQAPCYPCQRGNQPPEDPAFAGAYRPNPDRAEAPNPRPDGFGALLLQPRRSRTRRYVRDCSWPDPRVWTQTAAAKIRSRRTRSHPLQCSRRSLADERVTVQLDRCCGRTDPACPARTVRHTRPSGANAINTTKNKKHADSHGQNESISNKIQEYTTEPMPPLATASHSPATISHPSEKRGRTQRSSQPPNPYKTKRHKIT